MPKMSVIVPVYNTEKYLRECIESVLAQTFSDLELILVDDGSTDGSGVICDEYADKDPRVRVFHQENGGVTKARKAGAAISKGDYVTYVDSDDWIDRDCYRTMMSGIEENHADVGVFAMVLEKKPPEVICGRIAPGFYAKEALLTTVCPHMLFDYSANCSGLIASLCNKIVRREILQNAIAAISDSLGYGEDAICAYLCLLNASSAYICGQPFYHYRDNPISITHANSSVMEKRILALDREMRHQFAGYGADMMGQVDGHIMRHSVEWVRGELICPSERSFSDRCRSVRAFCRQSQIASALKNAYPKIRNKKQKIKVLLIKYRMFRLLYFLFRKN